ncbi:DUF1226-domain-containing protein [Basidiobolus meristosporus CBS 931.73]|uniref:DUF1226-domain-containing protein n=1 Tax=Basidiobolus meristosporus CBS 931.73 TaxID=1314790 RepID=A0A1Y1YES3_9FUNG|nr:DUF1226-domain-containing protein [Basidiobolus meristosporus CBS 931.73]|eukprot:ORX96423.1 DUF1226-domain-containing protein [Basidiobolus meristosporus CBS 931.73]
MLFEVISVFLTPVIRIVDPWVNQLSNFFSSPKTQRFLVKAIVSSVVFLGLLATAVFAYGSFYMIHIPKVAHDAPVFLQYSQESSQLTAEVLFTDYKPTQFLRYGQGYDVVFDLHVPTSEQNTALVFDSRVGNFMVQVELQNAQGETLHKSARSAILKYQSPLLRFMCTIWKAVPLLLNLVDESQTISVKMIERVVENYDNPITHASVTISSPKLQIYSAMLRLDARFEGLRYFMYYWSTTTAVVFVILFFLWEVVFSFIAWKVLVSWWNQRTRFLEEPQVVPTKMEDDPWELVNPKITKPDDEVEGDESDAEIKTALSEVETMVESLVESKNHKHLHASSFRDVDSAIETSTYNNSDILNEVKHENEETALADEAEIESLLNRRHAPSIKRRKDVKIDDINEELDDSGATTSYDYRSSGHS